MDYVKRFWSISLMVLLSGCSTLRVDTSRFEEGFRLGAKENIQEFAGSFYGNDFPYFYWQSPIVQQVRIPAHIENGLFVPEHFEPVLIQPGEWRKEFGYPITSPKNKKEPQKQGGDCYAFK